MAGDQWNRGVICCPSQMSQDDQCDLGWRHEYKWLQRSSKLRSNMSCPGSQHTFSVIKKVDLPQTFLLRATTSRVYICSYPPQRSTLFACCMPVWVIFSDIKWTCWTISLISENKLSTILTMVVDWVLVKSLMGSNCFVPRAPMMILLSLCFSVKFKN